MSRTAGLQLELDLHCPNSFEGMSPSPRVLFCTPDTVPYGCDTARNSKWPHIPTPGPEPAPVVARSKWTAPLMVSIPSPRLSCSPGATKFGHLAVYSSSPEAGPAYSRSVLDLIGWRTPSPRHGSRSPSSSCDNSFNEPEVTARPVSPCSARKEMEGLYLRCDAVLKMLADCEEELKTNFDKSLVALREQLLEALSVLHSRSIELERIIDRTEHRSDQTETG
mmetsp:Transcript_34707/g.79165  ORF Transcript_34707/g.79165 Transcript_34707/m.79165 type:complete len:222 (-) Transcript_34707:35-700(-)